MPIANRVIRYKQQYGIIFEHLHGQSMLTEMSAKPWTLLKYAKVLANMQSEIQIKNIPNLAKQRAQFIKKIRSLESINQQPKDYGLSVLNSLPDGGQLCHGDYHPDNIMITNLGTKIIDWTTSASGNPIADIARTSLMLQLGELPPETPLITRWTVNIGRTIFHKLYLKQYFRLHPKHKIEFKKWLLPIALVPLSEGIKEEQHQLLALIKRLEKQKTA